ncbi:unnamed protein product [Clonostachys rhizophaga]|uniref:HNH nuclease domain-containing protein n=1 Tax=Clonostachys rhizophaga TaxID=160324 RepID=A0A9N9VQ47_9HYPO|nr:unnamed protein product [Clonostachys rhizophaga]
MSNRLSPPTVAQNSSAEGSPRSMARIEEIGTIQVSDLFSGAIAESILALYQKNDPLSGQACERSDDLRERAIRYYGARLYINGKSEKRIWCHITGEWQPESHVEVTHIVPIFVISFGNICELLFGSKSDEVDKQQNTLTLLFDVKKWFDRHELVVVPWDATENPITRWRTDVFPSIHNEPLDTKATFRDLDGKELIFRDQNRPSSRFLYFHFIMSLIRIKDLNKEGWRDIWARYYEQPPFPAPAPYMRKSMILALATHFESTDMHVIESWIVSNGFGSPLNGPLATETARQVHMAIEYHYVQQQMEDEEKDSTDGEDMTDEEEDTDKEEDTDEEG